MKNNKTIKFQYIAVVVILINILFIFITESKMNKSYSELNDVNISSEIIEFDENTEMILE